VPGVIEASNSAWSYGGSILTFLFPMILFIVVAIGLYVVYTKPSVVPGHREQTVARPIGFTPVAKLPDHDEGTAGEAPAAGPQYAFPAPGGQAASPGNSEGAPGNPGAAPGKPEGAQ
jgi:hypothetical protein